MLLSEYYEGKQIKLLNRILNEECDDTVINITLNKTANKNGAPTLNAVNSVSGRKVNCGNTPTRAQKL